MCSIGSVVFVEMTRLSIYNIQIPYVSRIVIFFRACTESLIV